MGLSASQARLLTITSRKSDCEFQSMRLSHEKLSISRDLAQLSNKYQNSLDQTKLMYDFYGTGEGREQLNYNTLMSPSALNDYMPITITNNEQRIVLSSKYASAAKAAGIPQEGLGCTPSSEVRKKFTLGLLDSGVIDMAQYNKILSIPYNQGAGLGSDGLTITQKKTVTMSTINEMIKENCYDKYSPSSNYSRQFDQAKSDGNYEIHVRAFTAPKPMTTEYGNFTETVSGGAYDFMNLRNLMNLDGTNQQFFIGSDSVRSEQTPVTAIGMMQHYLTDENGFVDWLKGQFSSVLVTQDPRTTSGVNYAADQLKKMLTCDNGKGKWLYAQGDSYDGNNRDEDTEYGRSDMQGCVNPIGTVISDDVENTDYSKMTFTNHIGFVLTASNKGRDDDGNDHSTAAINLNNLAKTFLTYYANFMNGLEKVTYDVHKGGVFESQLVTRDPNFSYEVTETIKLDTDSARVVAFYDTLLNQICTNGWSENDEVNDNSYLQQMLQNGMMHVTTIADDCFYYQKNYATWSYVVEVSDDKVIAKAEAEYKTQKEKLNTKEQTLDLKMKNLDTEISTLTTEYDTVKNLISKNIEKGFKRYNA